MQLRYYQSEAVDALDSYLAEKQGNPCIVIPTAGGKTIVMATACRNYVTKYAGMRIMIVAHVKELLEQGAHKLRAIWPDAPIGIYCAGLGQKDASRAITYASIQSIFRRGGDIDPIDLLLIDEAHRVPLSGDGQYQQLIRDLRLQNPDLRVAGFTATPYRLAGGPVCGPEYILNDICYEVGVKELIHAGYLCPLTTKAAHGTPDLSKVHVNRGEFVESELADLYDQAERVKLAVAEVLDRAADRRAIILFCVNVDHAFSVSEELERNGIEAPIIHAGTDPRLRAQIIADFQRGKYRTLVNVSVLCEGFDAPHIDCVVLLRPTQSAGMFYQQVGRGLRLLPGVVDGVEGDEERRDAIAASPKPNCLVLDFAGNTERHGPIDMLEPKAPGKGAAGEAPAKSCPECDEVIHASVRICPVCGYEFPAPAPKHETKASEAQIISEDKPFEVRIERVTVGLHSKLGKPDSIKVTYHAGLSRYYEWICLEHGGYAAKKSRDWWRKRFGEPVPETTNEALQSSLFLAQQLAKLTKAITVKQNGRRMDIVSHELNGVTAGDALIA